MTASTETKMAVSNLSYDRMILLKEKHAEYVASFEKVGHSISASVAVPRNTMLPSVQSDSLLMTLQNK